jgi:hypothetical protein
MATSLSTQKPVLKRSQVILSNYHLSEKHYAGFVTIDGTNHVTDWFDTKEKAKAALPKLEKELGYAAIETLEMEGFYPERAKIIEDLYHASGRTNGLYTGLNTTDG